MLFDSSTNQLFEQPLGSATSPTCYGLYFQPFLMPLVNGDLTRLGDWLEVLLLQEWDKFVRYLLIGVTAANRMSGKAIVRMAS